MNPYRNMHGIVDRVLMSILLLLGLLPGAWLRPQGTLTAGVGQARTGMAQARISAAQARTDFPSFWQDATMSATPFRTATPTATRTPLQPQSPTPSRTPTSTPTATPTATPTLIPTPTLPPSTQVEGIYGYGQLLPLSCESRSAADWARHFGVEIHELAFFNAIPRSDDPEEGFVGSPYGSWGQIPPGAYGVHAGPVAELLREHGAQAQAVREMRFEDLKRELAAGRPVMIWVVGHVEPGKGVPYEVNGKTVTVARFEHTVVAIGYDDEQEQVSILDGSQVYRRSYETFERSWGALENMAILWVEE